ncbi:uncharacterized protein LOC123662503 [Melitaea cinxia]|uniref:uncharacterized protein LOC123662503 n=1 Tax=Melitaea cinxia TaxID=113334 RepID=UPI001E271060|nr:uncharacterized protein LOC123662503 [Melitaea cinxia]
MEEIKMMLINMQQENRETKSEMLAMKEDITTTIINNLNEKFTYLETKQNLLETKLQQQNTAIKNFDRYLRRKNLILFGVEEQEKSYHDLEKTVIEFINEYFNLQYNNCSIEDVRRLGKKKDAIRPIKITFTTMGLKINILRNKKLLKNTPFYFKEDYPLDILNKRKELLVQLKKEKQLGHKAYIRYDKLIVLKIKINKSFIDNQIKDIYLNLRRQYMLKTNCKIKRKKKQIKTIKSQALKILLFRSQIKFIITSSTLKISMRTSHKSISNENYKIPLQLHVSHYGWSPRESPTITPQKNLPVTDILKIIYYT